MTKSQFRAFAHSAIVLTATDAAGNPLLDSEGNPVKFRLPLTDTASGNLGYGCNRKEELPLSDGTMVRFQVGINITAVKSRDWPEGNTVAVVRMQGQAPAAPAADECGAA